ncbi:MAG: hypothetical protein ACI9J2_001025, partial [Saprospiraceae bacterium]
MLQTGNEGMNEGDSLKLRDNAISRRVDNFVRICGELFSWLWLVLLAVI